MTPSVTLSLCEWYIIQPQWTCTHESAAHQCISLISRLYYAAVTADRNGLVYKLRPQDAINWLSLPRQWGVREMTPLTSAETSLNRWHSSTRWTHWRHQGSASQPAAWYTPCPKEKKCLLFNLPRLEETWMNIHNFWLTISCPWFHGAGYL